MSKWREVRLQDICKVNGGKRLPKGKFTMKTKTDYPYLRITDLGNHGNVNLNSIEYITKEIYEKIKKYVISKEDIFITIAGTIGLSSKIPEEIDGCNLTENCAKLTLNKNKVNQIYLLNYLKLKENEELFKSYSSGSSQPKLALRSIRNFRVLIPDLKTQEKIADILSTYDELIENNNRRIEILEKTAEEIYKEWFVRMRFPGYENTKFIKGIPEGWEVKRVGDLAKFKRGKNLVIRDAIPGEVPVIAGGMEPSCYHNEANTNAPVITVSASGANAGYTQLNHVDVWASDCSYIDINDTYLIYYIYLLLKVSHKEILNLQLGSAQPHVYARDLNNFKFLKPDMKLIKKINNHAKDIFGEIKYLSSTNQNLIKQRDLLLPRLMNGTIEVK